MPPIGPPGTHKRRPRKRRPAPRRAPASLVPGVGSSLRNAALNAPARPLSRAKKPPRVVHVEHAAKRASRQIPGIADVRPTPRPLQAQPPRRPLGAKPRGRSRPGSRKERQKGINRVARSLLTQPEPKREQHKKSFVANILKADSPVGAGLRQGNPVIGVLSSVAGRAALNVGRVLFGDPGKQGPKLLRDTGESIVSIPAGLARSVTDPSGAAKNLVKDYDRRYRPLLEGDDAAFRKRMEKEGVAPEVFDLAGLAAGEGAVAGRALQSAAKTGSLGRTAARIATERPALQLSGGTVKAQAVSDNFFRNVVRHGVDTARKNKQASRAARPQASALVKEAEEAGNVTKLFKGTQERAQTRAVAQNKGRKLQAMKAEQQAEVGESTRAIRSLSKPEQRAFKYAMQYGATTPEAARRVLTRHRENVALNRVAHEARTGEKIPGRQNELPEIDYLLEHADKAFTPRLAAVMRQERARGARAAEQDPGVDVVQAVLRSTKPQAELLGIARREGEPAAQAAFRGIEEASRRGLEAPGYFPSEKRAEGVFSAFAVGGRQAVKGPGRYTGALTQTGRESGALDVFPRGVARNIKRKYNWNLVAENFDQHAFKWSKGKTIEQLKDEMERRGIDPNSVAFWNPRKFREEQQSAAGLEGRDVEAGHVTPEAGDVHTAAQLATNPSAFKDSTGWSLIPKAVHDEIMQDTRPSGAGWRGFDIAKGKVSRILLGNPGWLQFQTASNAFLTGLSGTGPVDAVKAQVWWRKLSQEQKRAIEPYLGIHRWYDDQTHLGAAANNRMVNAYRAFKETGLYRAAHKANPLDALFRADNAQNNFFRKAVFYNKAKRETYKRMGRQSGQIMALQQRAMRVLSLPPERMMDAVIKDAETFERLADHTNKFLGDYTTYTAKERRVLGRTVMFYGFLRYSVKFTLYTMPIEHPIVSSILTQIGRLERDEQKKIFGSDVPPWELGNLYTEDGRKVALARLNPFFNANQFEGGPGALVGMTSPLAQVVANQLAGKNVAFGRPYTAHGSGAYIEQSKELDAATRAKIALAETAQIFPPYRLAAKGGIPGIESLRGKQTSTSSLFFPDPVRYKRTTKVSEEAHQRNEQRKREEAAGGVGRQLREQLLPLSGVEGGDVIRRAREFDEAERKKKRKKKPAGPRDLLGGAPGTGQLPDLLAP